MLSVKTSYWHQGIKQKYLIYFLKLLEIKIRNRPSFQPLLHFPCLIPLHSLFSINVSEGGSLAAHKVSLFKCEPDPVIDDLYTKLAGATKDLWDTFILLELQLEARRLMPKITTNTYI